MAVAPLTARSGNLSRVAQADRDTEWDDLRYFLAACRAGSFTQAAKALGVGQATMSRRIAVLEERVGHPLFDRKKGGLALTAAAELLRPYAESMADASARANAAIQGFEVAPEGDVRLALTPSVAVELLPPFLSRLRKKHPKLRLHVVSDPDAVDVGKHEVDIAIRTQAPETGDVLVRRLADVSFGVFGSAKYVASIGKRPKLDELELIGWGGELAHLPQAAWTRRRVKTPPCLSGDTTLLLTAMAKQSLGAVVLPELVARIVGLERVPVKTDDLPGITFYLVVHRALRAVPRVAAVVDFLLEALASTAGK